MLMPMTENRLNGNDASQQVDAHALSGSFRDNRKRQMLYDAGKPKRYLARNVIYRESDWVDRIAVDDVEVEQIAIHNLQRLHRNDPMMFSQLLCQWHGALVHADRWISDFSTGGIKPRVARLVEFLAELEYGKPLDRVELLTVCEMAEILGVTQESVSRILATFKRRDILLKQPDPSREIYRLDAARLQQEARK
jgi:hypothetical protein